MTWNDNLREASYTSPLGFRSAFLYEDVSRSFDKRTSSYEFPTGNGTYVQDLGRTGKKYPLRIFFWGDNYDAEALQFEAQLQEKGVGRLSHPAYGIVNVIPFGTITRRDDLKTVANQAVIEVTFWETLLEIYAGALTDIADIVFGALTLYNEAASGQLNAEILLDKVSEVTAFKSFYSRLTSSVVASLGSIAASSPEINTQFIQVNNSMTRDLQSSFNPDVATLGLQTTTLIQLPAKASDINIDTRLGAYKDSISKITNPVTIINSVHDNRIDNDFYTRDMHAATFISGLVSSVINNVFVTKVEVLTIADEIISIFDAWVLWRDEGYEALGKDDTGNMYESLLDVVSIAIGYLVQLSFTLQTERRIILSSPRSIIDLVAELYGTIDDKLDFFINSNNLTGSEILEIPRGREIVYYI